MILSLLARGMQKYAQTGVLLGEVGRIVNFLPVGMVIIGGVLLGISLFTAWKISQREDTFFFGWKFLVKALC